MKAFQDYAQFYDLLYRDKDYAEECRYVESLFAKHGARPEHLLELGCGTGAHAECFARSGFRVTGLDQSEAMLAAAWRRRAALPEEQAARLDFAAGDLRDLSLGRTFDAVTALFHVMSYQAGEGDLDAALESVARHLAVGGLFLFDCWYGPAVQADPPTQRVKTFEFDGHTAERTARPTHHPERHRVDVEFLLQVDGAPATRETHHMRYFFLPELVQSLEKSGLHMLGATRWMGSEPPGADCWYACIVAQKVARSG